LAVARSHRDEQVLGAALQNEHFLCLHTIAIAAAFDRHLTAPLPDSPDDGVAMDEPSVINL